MYVVLCIACMCACDVCDVCACIYVVCTHSHMYVYYIRVYALHACVYACVCLLSVWKVGVHALN